MALFLKYGGMVQMAGMAYYGGARESRTIERSTYYGWEETTQIVRELQPEAVIFSDAGPDLRWVGNEHGIAGDPCWQTYTPAPREGEKKAGPGTTKYQEATKVTGMANYGCRRKLMFPSVPAGSGMKNQNERVRKCRKSGRSCIISR